MPTTTRREVVQIAAQAEARSQRVMERAVVTLTAARARQVPTTTRRQAVQIVAAAVVATVVLPIKVVPDALDGMARDFMRATPGLSYETAYQLAETV